MADGGLVGPAAALSQEAVEHDALLGIVKSALKGLVVLPVLVLLGYWPFKKRASTAKKDSSE